MALGRVSRAGEEKTHPCVKQNRKGWATQDLRFGHAREKERGHDVSCPYKGRRATGWRESA
jgi:hypothetical protein